MAKLETGRFWQGFTKHARARGDLLPGGLADNKTDKDFPKSKIQEGEKEEREHTNDPQIAREIARDHLFSDSRYYDKLKLIER